MPSNDNHRPPEKKNNRIKTKEILYIYIPCALAQLISSYNAKLSGNVYIYEDCIIEREPVSIFSPCDYISIISAYERVAVPIYSLETR